MKDALAKIWKNGNLRMQVSKVDSVATPGAVKQTTSHFNSIDALRGFAAVGVVLYHLWNRFYPGLSTQSRALDLPVVVGGGAGLSGCRSRYNMATQV